MGVFHGPGQRGGWWCNGVVMVQLTTPWCWLLVRWVVGGGVCVVLCFGGLSRFQDYVGLPSERNARNNLFLKLRNFYLNFFRTLEEENS